MYYHMLQTDRRSDVLYKFSKLTAFQKAILQTSFAIHSYPNKTILKELAQQTKLYESTVYNWFRMKRGEVRRGKRTGTLPTCE